MNNVLPKITINRYSLLYLIVLASFLLVYFKDYIDGISYLLTLILVGVVFLYYVSNRDLYNFDEYEFFAFLTLFVIVFISVIYNNEIARSYLFIVSIACLYYLFNVFKYKKEDFINAYNTLYIVYVILSGLLYFGVIGIGREINAFQENFLGYSFTTFYGFLGSTASIDSYSAVTVLVNMVFNRKVKGYIIVVIALFITLGTFRETSFLILFGPLLIIGVVRVFGNKLIIPINFLFFFSFAIPLVISLILENELVIPLFDLVTTGRASLWVVMIDEYLSREIFQLMIGFGNTTSIQVDSWKENISNPHNAYFTMLISYGVIVFSFLYFFLTKKMMENTYQQLIIIYGILLAGVSNGQLFDFFAMPMVLFLLILISNNKRAFSNHNYHQIVTNLKQKKISVVE